MPSGTSSPPGGGSWLSRLRRLPNDSPLKAVAVTLTVCLVGSILVSGSAVLLKPLQLANKERERVSRLSEIIAGLPGDDGPAALKAHVVDLAAGRPVDSLDAARFDQRGAARDPDQSIEIPPERDLAQIGRRSRFAVVYLVHRHDQLELIILPVHGRGFGSMLYGYLGLAADTRQVVGLTFYEHGETPGLGALIDSREWLKSWRGKQVWDPAGEALLGAADGAVDRGSPEADYLVDGLTGATWTSRGVTNLLRFWLGDDGFGPYLRTLRARGG